MNNIACEKLCAILAEHGHVVVDDPRRMRALLMDHCPALKREIYVLVLAQEQRVFNEILTASATLPWEVLSGRLVRRLVENCAIDPEAARWAVDACAVALGRTIPPPAASQSVSAGPVISNLAPHSVEGDGAFHRVVSAGAGSPNLAPQAPVVPRSPPPASVPMGAAVPPSGQSLVARDPAKQPPSAAHRVAPGDSAGDKRARRWRRLGWVGMGLAPLAFLASVMLVNNKELDKYFWSRNPVLFNNQAGQVNGETDFLFEVSPPYVLGVANLVAQSGGVHVNAGGGPPLGSTIHLLVGAALLREEAFDKIPRAPSTKYYELKEDSEKPLLDGARIDAPQGFAVVQDELSIDRKLDKFVISGKWSITPPLDCPEGEHDVRVIFPAVAAKRATLNASSPRGDTVIMLKVRTATSPEKWCMGNLVLGAGLLAACLLLAPFICCAIAGPTVTALNAPPPGWVLLFPLAFTINLVFLGTEIVLFFVGRVFFVIGMTHFWENRPEFAVGILVFMNLAAIGYCRVFTGEMYWSRVWAIAICPWVLLLGILTAAGFTMFHPADVPMSFKLLTLAMLPGPVFACCLALFRRIAS